MATVMVRRANVILEVNDDDATVNKYLNDGFDVIENGKVVRQSTHGKDPAELQAMLDEANAEIKRLKIQIKKLKETPAEAPKKTKKAAD